MELEVTLVKQWFWCPRHVYFRYVLGIREPVFEFLRDGKALHESLTQLEEVRRTLLLRKEFQYDKKLVQVHVYSKRLGLRGVLDLLLIKRGRPIPVEIKLGEKPPLPYLHHKAQLTAYALCLEDMFGKYVSKGYIYYIKSDDLTEITVTDDLKRLVSESLEKIRECLRGAFVPSAVQDERKCRNCWFRRFCLRL